MERWGDRLRRRAKELGLSDADVARRLGLAPGRYSTYVNMTREPDFATFVRICGALQTTPDEILGVVRAKAKGRADPVLARAAGVLAVLDPTALLEATEVLEVMARHRAARDSPSTGRPGAGPARKRSPFGKTATPKPASPDAKRSERASKSGQRGVGRADEAS